ncbi:MAG: 23S rRNA (uracil(1939)-C(5))-methyltransferase RlmD [Limnothrix sp.]|nr:23S rRNA (uracil(1939)-C(5))-methyltransferase RlmD [Limnothrix sp.]
MQLAGGDRPIERHDAIELWRASIVSPHLCAGPVRFPVAAGARTRSTGGPGPTTPLNRIGPPLHAIEIEADRAMTTTLDNQMNQPEWKQGAAIELEITDLADSGDGVGRWADRVVFVPETVPGDYLSVRLLQVKPTFARAKILSILDPSPDRVRPGCIVADKCGGCQWQHVAYGSQLLAKQRQVEQALTRLGGFEEPPVLPILAAAAPLAYRNKATYPVAPGPDDQIRAGYYQKGSHKIVNLNQCPVQDDRLDPLLRQVKQDLTASGWEPYDETTHTGTVRHLALRIGRRTGEMLLTLVVRDWEALPGLATQAELWREQFPQLVGVCVNQQPQRNNVIFGPETRCVLGRPALEEYLNGLVFEIRPETFFQVNTDQTEELLKTIHQQLALTGREILVDAYCGVGTLTLPLAQRAGRAIGIEAQAEAVTQARHNAERNQLTNVEFQVGKVADLLPQLGLQPDVVLLDPPRKGCEPGVIEALRAIAPSRIVYMSCKPATLARDLKLLCEQGQYQLDRVQPADFFPQTPHVECVAFLSERR